MMMLSVMMFVVMAVRTLSKLIGSANNSAVRWVLSGSVFVVKESISSAEFFLEILLILCLFSSGCFFCNSSLLIMFRGLLGSIDLLFLSIGFSSSIILIVSLLILFVVFMSLLVRNLLLGKSAVGRLSGIDGQDWSGFQLLFMFMLLLNVILDDCASSRVNN